MPVNIYISSDTTMPVEPAFTNQTSPATLTDQPIGKYYVWLKGVNEYAESKPTGPYEYIGVGAAIAVRITNGVNVVMFDMPEVGGADTYHLHARNSDSDEWAEVYAGPNPYYEVLSESALYSQWRYYGTYGTRSMGNVGPVTEYVSPDLGTLTLTMGGTATQLAFTFAATSGDLETVTLYASNGQQWTMEQFQTLYINRPFVDLTFYAAATRGFTTVQSNTVVYTPIEPVQALSATYSRITNLITVRWLLPLANKQTGITVIYRNSGGLGSAHDLPAGATSHTYTPLYDDTYTIEVQAKYADGRYSAFTPAPTVWVSLFDNSWVAQPRISQNLAALATTNPSNGLILGSTGPSGLLFTTYDQSSGTWSTSALVPNGVAVGCLKTLTGNVNVYAGGSYESNFAFAIWSRSGGWSAARIASASSVSRRIIGCADMMNGNIFVCGTRGYYAITSVSGFLTQPAFVPGNSNASSYDYNTACRLLNGLILVAGTGGHIGNYLYNPSTSGWGTQIPVSASGMSWLCSCLMPDLQGRVFLGGTNGYYGIYDPNDHRIRAYKLATARNIVACTVIRGEVVALGSASGDNAYYTYNPISDKMSDPQTIEESSFMLSLTTYTESSSGELKVMSGGYSGRNWIGS